jgi:hypothetical protein
MWPIEFIKKIIQWLIGMRAMAIHKKLVMRVFEKNIARRRATRVKRAIPGDKNELEVVVELPRGLIANRIRKLRIASPATADEISKELALRFDVDRNVWKLFGSLDKKETPKMLGRNDLVDTYRSDRNPNARLYFYPEVTVR